MANKFQHTLIRHKTHYKFNRECLLIQHKSQRTKAIKCSNVIANSHASQVSHTSCAHQCPDSSSFETLRSLNTKTKKISHQQILDCVIILQARPRTKNYSAWISCNLVQLIRLFITVFTLTPPKVYTDPLQPIRPNNYITESPPNWHIYCHAELHSMDLQSIDLHADIQVFI